MSKPYNKYEKKRRRISYLKRRKVRLKTQGKPKPKAAPPEAQA